MTAGGDIVMWTVVRYILLLDLLTFQYAILDLHGHLGKSTDTRRIVFRIFRFLRRLNADPGKDICEVETSLEG